MTVEAASNLLTCLDGTNLDYLQVDLPLSIALLIIVDDCELVNFPLIV